jgi:DNA-binding beta-propeller fold protein YncE
MTLEGVGPLHTGDEVMHMLYMRLRSVPLVVLGLALGACRVSPPPGSTVVPLPDGRPGIGFDDLRFSSTYGVLAPGGRSGNLDLVDPQTRKVTAIGGFSMEPLHFGGHDQGATSADEGGGLIFVTDRTTQTLAVVDPATRQIVATTPVATMPDYVRYVPQTNEVWVTEPDASLLEVFSLSGRQPAQAAVIATPGGPESLVIDRTRDRAYTHLWAGGTISIDVRTRAIVEQWSNGCSSSRGIALDEPRGFLFAGCNEGRGTVADVTHGGAILGTLDVPAQDVDVIDYSISLAHLYLPGSSNATMAIAGVSSTGQLSLLATVPTVTGAHCAAADDRGNAYVCDPDNGELLVIADTTPASGR